MATFDPLHPLYSSIIETIAEFKSISAAALQRRLHEKCAQSISSATLYRRLSELVEQQVLLRYKCRFSLNLVWVSHLLHFGEILRQNYAMSPELVPLPRREGEHRDYEANSLANLDPIWNNIHVELGMRHGERVWYGYNSHPWYPLGMPETEQRLQESFVANGYHYHLLYGNDSFLDRYGHRRFEVEGYHTGAGRPPQLGRHNHAVWAGQNFTLECILPEAVAARFARFFEEVRRPEDFNRAEFAKVFRIKALCRLRVKKSRREADKLRKLLLEYFTAQAGGRSGRA